MLKLTPSGIERFFDSILLGTHGAFLSSCPEEYAKINRDFIKVYNQNEIVAVPGAPVFFISDLNVNFYCSLFACFWLILILALNRRRNSQSPALRLFTNYYLGILLGQTFLNLLANFSKIFFPVSSSNGLCAIQVVNYEVIPAWSGETSLSRFQTYASTISTIFNSLAYHLLPIYLILHRFTTYCACAFPFFYKRHLKINRLMVYYPLLGSIIFVYHFACNIIASQKQRLYEFWDPFDNGFSYKVYDYINEIATTIFVITHFIITVICIYAILKFSNSTQNEMKELRSFLGFSIGPTAISIIFQFISFFNGSSWINDGRDTFGAMTSPFLIFMRTVESLLLIIFQPLYTCILYVIFVPFYRKLFCRLFCCCCNKPSGNIQVHPVIILSISRNI